MLLCNNTAIRPICVIKLPASGAGRDAGVPRAAARSILLPMSKATNEEDDLARRFFGLWAEYLAALAADPKLIEPVGRWLALAAGALHNPAPGDASPWSPPWSPAGPQADAAAAAGASGQRDAVVVELARRVEELARRVAALEAAREHDGKRPGESRTRPAAGPRRRNPSARS
jgi:hypothetical protein